LSYCIDWFLLDCAHRICSNTPVRFSQELIDGLQSSAESDSTRSSNLELHIQDRVAKELSRLRAQEEKNLKELEEKISSATDGPEPIQGFDGNAQAGAKLRSIGRESVQKDISSLKEKLDKRKKIEDLDKGVEKARTGVIACLRLNDRRPLDCWKEVEEFKKEVGKLEKDFVRKVVES
jgi:MICOS complex subunit MIC19